MADAAADRVFRIPEELHGRPLDGALRLLGELPWNEARRMIETGKVSIAGEVITTPTRRVRKGDVVELRLRAPRPRVARARAAVDDLIVYLDPAVVVRKPAGISTVPYEGDDGDGEDPGATLDALVRDVVARRDRIRGRAPLGVVQRLDKPTSGLIVFARTFAAKKALSQQLRKHTMSRRYLAIAHGSVSPGRIESFLVADRGDRLRGSSRRGAREGQRAVTHVDVVERLPGATLVGCRLETGRTHQIRIHLAESGHPLLGEQVYVRDFTGPRIGAPRLMLHAAELGFEHPSDGRLMQFTDALPADFEETLARLRRA